VLRLIAHKQPNPGNAQGHKAMNEHNYDSGLLGSGISVTVVQMRVTVDEFLNQDEYVASGLGVQNHLSCLNYVNRMIVGNLGF
jgi:hypothetical protein